MNEYFELNCAGDSGLAINVLALQLPNLEACRVLDFLESDFVSRIFFFLRTSDFVESVPFFKLRVQGGRALVQV